MVQFDPAEVYKIALEAGLGVEGAKVAVAVTKYESGFDSGGVGDVKLGGSYGPYQFLWGGELGNFANALHTSLADAAYVAQNQPLTAVRWALNGYLGAAIKEGASRGFTGGQLADYAQLPTHFGGSAGIGQRGEICYPSGTCVHDIYSGLFSSGNPFGNVVPGDTPVGENPEDGPGEIGGEPPAEGGGTIELPGGIEIPIPGDVNIPTPDVIGNTLLKAIKDGFDALNDTLSKLPGVFSENIMGGFWSGVVWFFTDFLPGWFKQTVYTKIVGTGMRIPPGGLEPVPAVDLDIFTNLRGAIQETIVNARDQAFAWGGSRGVFLVFGVLLIVIGLLGLVLEVINQNSGAIATVAKLAA